MDTETAQTVAIKQIDLYSISNENISSIEGEINLLKNLDHLNIVKYIECIRTKTHINLVLEYVENGSLHQMVKQSGKMGEHLVFIFVKQILEGLAYLHNQGIIHRDIKGANLLLTKNGVVKLADFGYSILNDKNKVNSIVGTACFMAPEVIEQKGNISPKCDIWSLGSTIVQLLTTRPPYYEFEPMAAMFRIVTDDCPPLPTGISEHLKNFLLKCFTKDPSKRPSAKELLQHPWITTPNKKLVKKFINENNNSSIPINLINEWKNNYRHILASGNSSQNDRTASQNITEDLTPKVNSITCGNDYISLKNTNNNNENYTSKEKRKLNNNNNSKNNKDENLLKLYKQKRKQQDANYKFHPIGKQFLSGADENQIYANDQKNNNNDIYYNNINGHNNTHSIANANDKEECDKEKDIELVKEIEFLINSLKKNDEESVFNNINKKNFGESINLDEISQIQKNNNTEKLYYDKNTKINDIINDLMILEYSNTNNENNNNLNDDKIYYKKKLMSKIEYFLLITQNIGNFFSDKEHIKEFINSFKISEFINLFSSKYMSSQSLFLLLKYLNILLSKKENYIKDILINQINFHLSRYIYIFQDINIKIEITCFIYYCLISKPIIELFISSGGIFLLSTLINSNFLQGNEIIIILSLDYLLYIYDQFGNNMEDLSLQLIHNKILTRLNLLLIDLQNSEDNNSNNNRINNKRNDLEYENNRNLIYERLFSVLIKIASTLNKKYLCFLCNDKLIITLSQIIINLDSSQIENVLQIFDNIMADANNLNKLENIGFIDTLLKLLNKFVYSSELFIPDNQLTQKVIAKIINQISQIIKLSKSRSESFVMADGLDIMCSLANNNIEGEGYINQIVDILSELINATNFTRNKMKQSKTLELIVKLLIERKDTKIIKELTQIILDWVGEDKNFIEKYIIKDDKFNKLFKNLNIVLSGNDNANEFIQLLNDFFRASEEVEHKFFQDDNLVLETIKTIENASNNNKDIHLMNKIMDFYIFLIRNKKEQIDFLNKINFKRTIEKIKAISKERHLIIIEEKIKKLDAIIPSIPL